MTTADWVLLSMAKGIEELLKKNQGAAKPGQPEAVKPGAQELPKLPEYDPETAAIDMVHWTPHIGPILEDISDTSGLRWGDAATILVVVSGVCSSQSFAAVAVEAGR